MLKPCSYVYSAATGGSRSSGGGVDWVLVTDHSAFVSPKWFNSSLDAFVEGAEAQQRDFVFPAAKTLESGVSFNHSRA